MKQFQESEEKFLYAKILASSGNIPEFEKLKANMAREVICTSSFIKLLYFLNFSFNF